MTQITNNGLTVKLKNGTFFLNDDISVQFEEAQIDLNTIQSAVAQEVDKLKLAKDLALLMENHLSKHNHQSHPINETAAASKTQPSKPAEKKAIVKQADKVEKRGKTKSPLRAAVEAAFNDFIAQHDDFGGIQAFNHIKEVDGCEDVDIKMIYNIIQTWKDDGIIVSAEGKGRYMLPKIIPFVETPVPKEEEPVITEVAFKNENELNFKYPTGEVICIGDSVYLEDEDTVTEDDILFFPSEYEGANAVVVRSNEGSNAITVKLDDSNKEVLVYSHWISFIKRGY